MTDFEKRIWKLWANWLKRPGSAEQVVDACERGDRKEVARLFRQATTTEPPVSWVNVIARVNSNVT